MRRIIVLTSWLIGLCHFAAAEAVKAESQQRFSHAISINPLGLIFGSYGGNYELLVNQTHGIVVEGFYANTKMSSSSNESTAAGGGGALHYRWHWSKAMEPAFLGVFARYQSATGTGSVTSITVSSTSSTTTNETSFDVSTISATVGINIGKRWIWDSGLNIVARIGYGMTNFEFRTTSTNPEVMKFVDDVKLFLHVIAGFDAELSVGYAF